MTDRPTVLVFDVNETLSDLRPLGDRFVQLGVAAELSRVWFAGVLRDGFALAAAGTAERFAVLAADSLRQVLDGLPLNRDLPAAVDHVLAGFRTLRVHPDVPAGINALHAAGFRLVTLTNGATEVAERLLTEAGLRGLFEQLLSVEDAGVWKPAAAAYAYAGRASGVEPASMMLVAVHPWDIDGAARAGLQTAWINRTNTSYPGYFTAPSLRAAGVDDLARQLSE